VVDLTRQWIGTPYLHQASRKGVGCDCLGLVRGVWREIYKTEPAEALDYSSSWSEISTAERMLDAARCHLIEEDSQHLIAGNVLIFRMRRQSTAKHAGILSSPQHFIHAYEGNHVVENALSDFWKRRIAAVFRFPIPEGS